jgi:hypothetical protein
MVSDRRRAAKIRERMASTVQNPTNSTNNAARNQHPVKNAVQVSEDTQPQGNLM